jgi:Ca-activated chloride channel family protein
MSQGFVRFFCLVVGATFVSFAANSQEAVIAQEGVDAPADPSRLLIAYDSSNSMWGELADKSRKYEAGRTALSEFLNSDFGDREIGFRAYGHRRKNDCRDSEMVVPFSKVEVAKAIIANAVGGIRPTGKTPITYSLREGLKDFDGRPGDILLISDGIETCDIDPCELMREWRDAKVGIRVHVVGVGLTEMERVAMSCIADVSGGQYFDVDSADKFAEALNQAGAAIEEPVAEAAPVEEGLSYALRIVATDDQGRSYLATGTLFQIRDEGGKEDKGEVSTHGRNGVGGPGDYEIEVGPVLQDGSTYLPVRQAFSVTDPGETVVEVTVARPAIVTAKFIEDGEDHPGSNVSAYQSDEKVFGFRAFDEALARPGDYEFRAEPNADNKLSVTESLVAGEHTVVVFDLTRTIAFYVIYKLPNGETFRRGSELWRDGEKVYGVYAHNPTRVRPGVYELHSEHQNTPLTPVDIEISTDGEIIEVPLDAGFVKITYAPSDEDYVSTPDRAWLESLDRGNSKYANPDTLIPAVPGRYRVNPQTSKGFMDALDIVVKSNETVEAVLTPKPLGQVIITYAPSENYTKNPDRASITALDNQEILSGFMRPGKPKKFLPGRYHVKPYGYAGDVAPQEIIVNAHETTTVILKLRSEE